MTYNDDIFTHADAAHERLMFALEAEYLPDAGCTLEEAIAEAASERPRTHRQNIADALESIHDSHPGAFRKPQETEQP